uniref:Pecanex-like protein n=1 Tax=Panagrellus redivivus TaxID=6233 RepID=A0A7E4ZPZ4_PANRE
MERRQRRKARVLANGEARIQSLFTGSSPVSDHTVTSTTEASEVTTKVPFDDTKVSKFFGVSEADDEITCVPPNYAEKIEALHLQVVSFIGAIFALLNITGVITTIVPTWLTVILVYHLCRLTQSEKFPKHGYAVNFLLAGGIDERLVRYGGFVLDAGTAALIDSIVMTFSFVVVTTAYRVVLFFI